MNKNLVEVEALDLYLPDGRNENHILKGISFSVPKGARLGIVGESGSGKSMTMYSLCDLLPAGRTKVSGKIVYHGETDILQLAEKQKRLYCAKNAAIILQNAIDALNPYFRIRTQMLETIRFHHSLEAGEAEKRMRDLLVQVGIEDVEGVLRKYPGQLSGGMRQRVAIALALESDASLLIADEPTTSLDAVNQMRLITLIRKIVEEKDLTLIYISHNLGIIHMLCEDVLVMKEGEIVERGSCGKVFSAPRHPYTKALVEGTKELLGGRQSCWK